MKALEGYVPSFDIIVVIIIVVIDTTYITLINITLSRHYSII